MRRWTKSACMAVAWCILPLVAAAGPTAASPAQATPSIASSSISSSSTSSSHPAALAAVPATLTAATQAVAPATRAANTAAPALGVPGGRQALYAANRESIGPDPDVLRPGTVLVTPQAAAVSGASSASSGLGAGRPLAPSGSHPRPRRNPAPPKGSTVTPGGGTAPAGSVTRASTKAGAGSSSYAGVMPPWLKVTLLVASLLTMLAFLAEPLLVLGRRRRAAAQTGHARAQTEEEDPVESVTEKAARIIEASHERLIVTYSLQDHTIYLLSPPGEDPRMVLRAARLVVPEPAYQDLAGHLGIAPGWPEGGAQE